MFRNIALGLVVLSLLICVRQSQASFSYTTAGSTYSQNFDTLPNTPTNVTLGNSPVGWTNDTTTPGANQFSILGWHLYHPTAQTEGGANGNQRMRIGAGTANTGAFMSWGTAGTTDRAIGSLASNTTAALPPTTNGEQYIGLRITNNTGGTLVSFTVNYTGEQWRDGGTSTGAPSVAQSLTFGYKQSAAGAGPLLQDTGYTPLTTLDFVGPQFGATTQDTTTNIATNQNDRDGNAAPNRTVIGPVTITGLTWLDGTDLWLRWTDLNDANNDHGLGIDDLGFSAEAAAVVIPEPASLAVWGCLVALGLAGAKYFRR